MLVSGDLVGRSLTVAGVLLLALAHHGYSAQAAAEPSAEQGLQQGANPPPPSASPQRLADEDERAASRWPVVLGTERMGLGMSTQALELLRPKAHEANDTKRKIVWERRADCLDHALQIVIEEISERFGNVLVTSTCRTPEHNRRVGGVKHSQHIGGHAVDFYLYGDARKAQHYLRTHRSVGGLGYYGSGRFHVDNGPERDW